MANESAESQSNLWYLQMLSGMQMLSEPDCWERADPVREEGTEVDVNYAFTADSEVQVVVTLSVFVRPH